MPTVCRRQSGAQQLKVPQKLNKGASSMAEATIVSNPGVLTSPDYKGPDTQPFDCGVGPLNQYLRK